MTTHSPSSTSAKTTSEKARKPYIASLDTPGVQIKTIDYETETRLEAENLASFSDHQPRNRFGLRLFLTGFVGLISLSFGLWLNSMIEGLFSQTPLLGWIGLALSACIVLGLIIFIIREWLAISRLHHVDELREKARFLFDKTASEKTPSIEGFLKPLIKLYRSSPETAHGRQKLKAAQNQILDGPDAIVLSERDLLKPLDDAAMTIIMASVKRLIACHNVMNSDDMLSIIGLARILITIMNPLLWNTR
jgi:putative membrane protein